MRGTESTVLSSLTSAPVVTSPAPVPTMEPARDDRLLVGLGASVNNSLGRPFNPDLTAWEG